MRDITKYIVPSRRKFIDQQNINNRKDNKNNESDENNLSWKEENNDDDTVYNRIRQRQRSSHR